VAFSIFQVLSKAIGSSTFPRIHTSLGLDSLQSAVSTAPMPRDFKRVIGSKLAETMFDDVR